MFMSRTIKILISKFKLTSDAKIQPATREAGMALAFDFSHDGNALRPIFML